MKNTNLLLICQHFVPYSSSVGGIVRAVTLVEYLSNNNTNVYVLTSKGVDYGYFGYNTINESANITYLNDPIKSIIQGSVYNEGQISKKIFFYKLRIRINSILKEFLLPDYTILIVYRYYKKACELIESNNIKNVLISSPPHGMHIVGLLLKLKYKNNINYIVDYRDSWNLTSIYKKSYKLFDYICRLIEKKILSICDSFTYVSQPILDKIVANYQIDIEKKCLLVMNGYTLFPEINRKLIKEKKIRVGYFGMANDSKNGYRNIINIVLAINKIPNACEKIALEFYGNLSLSILDINNFSFIRYFGAISHQESLNKMIEMDFLLLLHSNKFNSDEVITGKFFDYVAAGKPIICLSPFNMEARRILIDKNLGLWCDINDINKIRDIFITLLERKYIFNISESVRQDFSRDSQYKKLRKLIDY